MKAELTVPETTKLEVRVIAGQLLGAQVYPVGQHPPPRLLGQADQPAAQLPLLVNPSARWDVPLLMVIALSGQSVIPQSRPILQQPPLNCAEHV